MSVEPPSSGRPTGPPSGPLSGPSQPSPTQPVNLPPAGPPSGASGTGDGAGGPGSGGTGGGGTGGGGSGPEGPGGGATGPGQPGGGPERPWWRSAPRVALITGVVAAAVILGLVFTNSGGGAKNAGSEVFAQPASKSGPDSFTESTANDSSIESETPAAPASSAPANKAGTYSGNAPGLYGGTRNVSSCDVEKQISALKTDPAKNKAFASVEGIQPNAVPAYLRSLTPVQLRLDTRVTNHGYRNGAPTSYQAVLQAGTAVLVDSRGVPRVRCACGNPLLEPVPQKGNVKTTGDPWPSYRPQNSVAVAPSATVINVFVLYDPESNEWIERHRGDDVDKDKKTHPPVKPSPSVSDSGSESPSASTSTSPSSESSSPSSSSSEPSSSEPSSSEPSSVEPESPSSEPPPPVTESAPASGSSSGEQSPESPGSSPAAGNGA
ncbi:DUF6777 domain-containing protein [Streptomyces sp. NPDC127066]|uniref:DUF6777 domain-containing protein n=1 Tax=Streptomyces sp. NPDC127066 TaxID=3347125 RepID=UPI00364E71BC